MPTYVDMSNKDYRSAEGISSTELKRMSVSMATYKYYKDHPQNGDSPALLFGRAYHKAILEPSTFNEEFAVSPNIDKRTKAGKEEYAKFVEEAKGKDIISQDDYNTIFEMQKVLYSTPFARKLLFGEHEKSYFWTDEKSGVKCKCRPDSWGKIGDRNIIIDLKTTQNAETEAFMRDAIKRGYDIQAAHYCDGMKANIGGDFTFVFVAQEKQPPYLVNILQADEYFMKSGNDVRDNLLLDYKECVERNEWKGLMGFSNEASINSLGVPKWLQKAYESEVETNGE